MSKWKAHTNKKPQVVHDEFTGLLESVDRLPATEQAKVFQTNGIPFNARGSASDYSRARMALSSKVAIARRVIQLTGASSVEQACEIVVDWKKSHEHTEQLNVQIARAKSHDIDCLIRDARTLGKLSPAEGQVLRDQFTSGDITLAGAKMWLDAKEAIPALRHAPPKGDSSGKSYAEMKPSEKARLKRENPEAFERLRAGSLWQ